MARFSLDTFGILDPSILDYCKITIQTFPTGVVSEITKTRNKYKLSNKDYTIMTITAKKDYEFRNIPLTSYEEGSHDFTFTGDNQVQTLNFTSENLLGANNVMITLDNLSFKFTGTPNLIDYNFSMLDLSYFVDCDFKIINNTIEYPLTIENDLTISVDEKESNVFKLVATVHEGKQFDRIPLFIEMTSFPYDDDYFIGDKLEQSLTFSGSYEQIGITNFEVIDLELDSEIYTFSVSVMEYDKATYQVEHEGTKYNVPDFPDNLEIKVFENEPIEFKLIVTAQIGSIFSDIPIYREFYDPVKGDYVKEYYSGTNKVQTRVVGEIGKKSYTIDIDTSVWNFEIEPTPDVQDLPYSKIYEVNETQLNTLANYSYITREIKSGFSYAFENLDYAKFFTGLHAYPYKIDTSNFDNKPILLGDINTSIVTKQIPDYLHDINLGNITIINNSTDKVGFKNIEVKLYVPYFNYIVLETDEVLGFEISLQLKLNVITGKGTLNVYSLRSDSIIYTETTQIGVKIPYTIGEKLDLSTSTVLETAYTKPFIQLKVLKPNNDIQIQGTRLMNIDNDYQYLKDDDNINLQSFATQNEQKLIKQAILNGIFIRKGV